jgi:GT2 family glycosyltransferase
MKVSLVLPYLDKWHLVHKRLMEYYRLLPKMEIILVDDCSQEAESITGPRWWKEHGPLDIVHIRNEENLGFGGANNVGAEHATGDILILTQNDVVVSGNFIPHVKETLRQHPKILVGGRVVYWEAGWNEFVVGGKRIVLPYAEGWLLAMWREAWDDLGGFDPLYGKMDYEDVDLSAMALSKGYNLVGLNSPHLKHIFGQTTTAQEGVDGRRAITEINRKKFYRKWKDWMYDWKIETEEIGHE